MKCTMKKIDLSYSSLAGIQAIVLAFLLLNCYVHDMSLLNGVKIFLYQFFAWFLAGTVIVDVLRIRTKDLLENIALSYAFGGILSLLIYMMFMLIGLKVVLSFMTVIEAFITILYIVKIRVPFKGLELNRYGVILCIAFLFIYYLLTTVIVSFVNAFPNELPNGNGYYVDWPFWVGNNISLTKQFPAYNFRQVGIPLRYHYFSSILMAQVSLCTGVDITKLSFFFSSFLFGIGLVFAAYYFSTRVLKKKWSVTLLMIVLLFTDGVSCSFTWHTSICPFGFDIGYAYGMISLGILAEILKKERFRELFIPSVILIAMTTGTKGPVGAIVLVVFGVTSIYYLFTHNIIRGVVSGVSWLGSFIGILFGFIRGTTTFSSEVGLTYIGGLGLDVIMTKAVPIINIYNTLVTEYNISEDRLLVKLYAIWLYIYRINRVGIFLLFLSIIFGVLLIRKKKFDIFLCGLIVASLAGIFCGIYFVQPGYSQMYFLMAIYPTSALAGMYSLEWIYEYTIQNKSKCLWNLFQSICVITILLLGISINRYYDEAREEFVLGLNVIRGKLSYENYGSYYCDVVDYEAYEWLKNNTDEDCIFAIDGHLDVYGINNSMMAGIFSQRYLWNEVKYSPQEEAERRDGIVGSLSSDLENTILMMKDEGVDYLLMQVYDGKVEYGSKTDMVTEVFRNSHYIIYKL